MSDLTAAFTSVFGAVAIALATTYAAAPALRAWLAGRGGLIDWITLVSLVAALVVGLWSAKRSASESSFRYVIPAIAAWGLLDETRYFTGLVGSPAATLEGVQVRSFDDLAQVFGAWGDGVGVDSRQGTLILAVLAVMTLVAVARASGWAKNRVLVTEHRVVVFIVVSIAFTIATLPMGLFGPTQTARFAAGLFEMTGATLLVVAGLAAADHRRTVAGWRRRLLPWTGEEGPLSSLGDRL